MNSTTRFTNIFTSTIATFVTDEDGTLPPDIQISKPNQKAQLALYDIMIPALGATVIVLNFAVVVSSGLILKKGTQPRSTYLFLGNVAMSDLVTGIAIVMGQSFPKKLRTQFTCAFQLGLIVSSTIVSIYSVGLIAVDRYLFIVHGLQYQRWVYPTRARLLIAVTWMLGCVVGFLPIMGWAGDTFNGKLCWFIKLVPPKLIVMTCAIAVIPIIIAVVLYSIILYHAIKKVIQLRGANKNDVSTNHNENQLRIFRGKTTIGAVDIDQTTEEPTKNIFKRFFMRKNKKIVDVNVPSKSRAVKIVVLTTGSFIITWVPYFVASFIYSTCDENVTPEKCKSLSVLIASPLAILGFCNSLFNPIIYAWWHRGFRNYVKKLFCKGKTSVNIPGTSSGTTGNSQKTTSRKESATSNTEIEKTNQDIAMENVQLH